MSELMRLGDRYELGDVLGRGGMAEVHRGRDLRLGREVAIKMLKVDLARDPSFQARFRREAQSAASLNHPAIVAVYDTGEDRIDDLPTGAPIPYIVMEYVNGETLRDVLTSGRKLLPERALEIVAETLQGLGLQPPPRHRASRHQAGQRHAHPDRRREGHGLRHRPRGDRFLGDDDPDVRGHRHRAVPLPGAGPGRAGRRAQRPVFHRVHALRVAHRAPAVHR